MNRATQGLYPIGSALSPLIRAEFGKTQPTDAELNLYFQKLGLFQAPLINMPVAFDTENKLVQDLRVSPLQVSLAAATLSNQGLLPTASIASAVNTPEQGWVVLSAENQPVKVMQAGAANEAALTFIVEGKPYWSHIGQAKGDQNVVITWCIMGTLPSWNGVPLVIVVTLEENNIQLAKRIGENILDAATSQ